MGRTWALKRRSPICKRYDGDEQSKVTKIMFLSHDAETGAAGRIVKDSLKELKKVHPKATKKEIILAAFGALVDVSDTDSEKAPRLQDVALGDQQLGSDA
jgi:hypothetical protein